MTTKVVPGQLVATVDATAASVEAATRMAKALRDAIEKRGAATFALSGGNTPRAAYALLAKDASVDWSKVEIFWVDERAVAPTDDRSNYRWAKTDLLDAAKIPAHAVHRMLADSTNLDWAAASYEALLRARVAAGDDGIPVLDVVVMGVGDDGHTASLFPGDPTVNVTHRLVAPVAANGAREARLTLTSPILEHAGAVFVLAVGKAKSAPLDRAWASEGSLDETPSRVIRGVRGSITWVIDRAAGGLD